MKQAETPKCYLSTSDGRWRVISGGLQVCADKPSRDEAMATARALKLTPTALWDGDAGVFKEIDAEPTVADCAAGAAGRPGRGRRSRRRRGPGRPR